MTTNNQTLPERLAGTIKSANDLLNESSKRLSQYESDDTAASSVIDQVVAKLASIQIHGEYVLPAERKDSIRQSMNTKHGMAEVLDQLVDILDNNKPTPKVASDLGAPASRPVADSPREINKFADLPSRTIRL